MAPNWLDIPGSEVAVFIPGDSLSVLAGIPVPLQRHATQVPKTGLHTKMHTHTDWDLKGTAVPQGNFLLIGVEPQVRGLGSAQHSGQLSTHRELPARLSLPLPTPIPAQREVHSATQRGGGFIPVTASRERNNKLHH